MKLKRLSLLVAALVSPVAAQANDWFTFEAGVGASYFPTKGNGTWYQEGFPYTLHQTSVAWEVGFTGNIIQRRHWGLDWHVDYADLGGASSDSIDTPSDANYNTSTHGCNGACWPLSHFVGSGTVKGVLLTLEPHYDTGNWRFGVEAGPFLYHPDWSETVYNWEPTEYAPQRTIQANYRNGIAVGAVTGASVSYKHFTLAYQYFFDSTHAGFWPLWRGTQTVMVKYRY